MVRHLFDIIKGIRFGKAASTAMAAVALASMCACSDSNVIDTPEVKPDNVSVSISFSISMDNAKTTRAFDPNEETTPGTDRENVINSAVIIIEDVKTGLRTPIVAEGLKEGTNTVKIEEISIGEKYIYVGANLSDDQIAAFCDNNKAYDIPASLTDRYLDMVEAYAPGFASSTRDDIAMFSDNRILCEFTAGQQQYDLSDQIIYLKRLVAKVLVTCKAESSADDAPVNFKDGSVLEQDGGWMHRNSVYFLVNGINRKSYIMQKPDEQNAEYYEDPNYSLADNIGTINGNIAPINTEDFYYNGDPKYYDISSAYMQTPFYEAEKIPTTAKGGNGVYSEGIYCPENTFSIADLTDAQRSDLANYKKAWPMITHVTITAKYTPKTIYAEVALDEYIQNQTEDLIDQSTKDRIAKLFSDADYDRESPYDQTNRRRTVKILNVVNEKDAITLLNFSLRMADYHVTGTKPSTAGLPDDTYYAKILADGSWQFHTYGAAKLKAFKGASGSNRMELGDGYSPYIGGRGYYSAYIDNRKDYNTPDKAYAGYLYGSVERNVYYILTIDNFSTPGSSNTESEVIEVHTQTIGWEMGGSGNITLQ